MAAPVAAMTGSFGNGQRHLKERERLTTILVSENTPPIDRP